jgi:hypothetical protein
VNQSLLAVSLSITIVINLLIHAIAKGPAPATAITASFADNGGLVDQNGLSLDSDSLNKFLGFFGDAFDPDTLLQLVICTALSSDGTLYSFGRAKDFLFNSGAAVEVTYYQCAVALLYNYVEIEVCTLFGRVLFSISFHHCAHFVTDREVVLSQHLLAINLECTCLKYSISSNYRRPFILSHLLRKPLRKSGASNVI